MTKDSEIIKRREEGFSVSMKAKRGTGTNDRDTVKVTGHFDDVDELIRRRADMAEALEMYADAARNVQPETEAEQ